MHNRRYLRLHDILTFLLNGRNTEKKLFINGEDKMVMIGGFLAEVGFLFLKSCFVYFFLPEGEFYLEYRIGRVHVE